MRTLSCDEIILNPMLTEFYTNSKCERAKFAQLLLLEGKSRAEIQRYTGLSDEELDSLSD